LLLCLEWTLPSLVKEVQLEAQREGDRESSMKVHRVSRK
jgi:hypothetical protein